MSNDLITWDEGIKRVVDNATKEDKVILNRCALYVFGESTTEVDGVLVERNGVQIRDVRADHPLYRHKGTNNG